MIVNYRRILKSLSYDIHIFQIPVKYFGRNDQFIKKEDQKLNLTQNERELEIPIDQLEIKFVRSSGPGGQNVNKLNTKAEIRFNLHSAEWLDEKTRQKFFEIHSNFINNQGEVIVTSQQGRDQQSNLSYSIKKLKEMIRISSIKENDRKYDIPAETEKEEEQRILKKRKRGEVKKFRNQKFWD